MSQKFSQVLYVMVMSLVLISCGGGGGDSSSDGSALPTSDLTSDAGGDTETPPADTPATGVPTSENHIMGPKYGMGLEVYHAELVMGMLRMLRMFDGFAGLPVGRSVVTSTPYELPYGSQEEVVNGVPGACQKNGESLGTRTLTWNQGGEAPAEYSSTFNFIDCEQSGQRFGTFTNYNGSLIQHGIATTGGSPHDIASGYLSSSLLEMTNDDRDIALTIDGYLNFNKGYFQGGVDLDIYESGLRIREVNDQWANSWGRYIEEIAISGTVEYDELNIVYESGAISIMNGIKNANLSITVDNNNQDLMALAVNTVPVPSDKAQTVYYRLKISRGENSIDPSSHHSIIIDRLKDTEFGKFNVYIDFNQNGTIETSGVFPSEFHQGDLNEGNWGALSGL